MKRRTLSVILLLVVLTACFISAPVISGEHPWDADAPIGSGTNSPNPVDDTTKVLIVEGDNGPVGSSGGVDIYGFVVNTVCWCLDLISDCN